MRQHSWQLGCALLLLSVSAASCGVDPTDPASPSASHERGSKESKESEEAEDVTQVIVELAVDPIRNPREVPGELLELLERFEAEDPAPTSSYTHPRLENPLESFYTYEIPASLDAASLVDQLVDFDVVYSAELPIKMETQFPLTHQWGHIIAKVTPGQAWSLATGQDIVVAVLDTGVDNTHVDLAANIWNNGGETPGNGVDDDGNGFVDDVAGWNFIDSNNNTLDTHSHGTHVAGIVAAPANGFGITGVAHEAEIMPVRILGNWGGSQAEMADGILYATDNGADVINISAGGVGYSQIVANAIEYANAADVVVVVAAGNSSMSACTFSPANVEQAITVGAHDNTEAPSWFTNHGNKVEVWAPGGNTAGVYLEDVLSTVPTFSQTMPGTLFEGGGKYTPFAGTSMAAPYVAGTIALMKELHPTWTAEAYRAGLRWGLQNQDVLDAHTAATYSPPSTPGVNVLAPRNCTLVDQTMNVEVVVLNNDYEVTLAGASIMTGTQGGGNSTASFVATTLVPTDFPDGDHLLEVHNINMPGSVPPAADANIVTIDNDYLVDLPPVLNPTNGVLDVQGRVVVPFLDSWQLSWENLDNGAQGVVVSSSPTPKDPEQSLGLFNMNGLPDGAYRLTLEVQRSGNPNFPAYVNVDTEEFQLDRDLVEGFPVQLPAFTGLSPKAADLDGDGHVEIIVGAAVYEDDGTPKAGWSHTPEAVRADAATLQVPAVVDVDSDGDIEVVAQYTHVHANGVWKTTAIRAYNPDGTTMWDFIPVSVAVPGPAWDEQLVSSLTIDDVDGDGDLEVFYGATVSPDKTRIHVVDAATGVEEAQFKVLGHLAGEYKVPSLAAGDLDGDGVKEIIATGHAAGQLHVHAVSGSGASVAGWPASVPIANVNEAKPSPLVFDLDGDCEPEVLVGGLGFDGDGTPLANWSTPWREDNAVIQIDPNYHFEVAAGWNVQSGLLRMIEHDGTVVHDFAQCMPPPTLSTGAIGQGDPVGAHLDSDIDPEVLRMSQCTDDTDPLSNARLLQFDTDGTVTVFKTVPMSDGSIDHVVTTTPLVGDLDGDTFVDIVAVAGDLLYHWELNVTYIPTLTEEFRVDSQNTGRVEELPCWCVWPPTC